VPGRPVDLQELTGMSMVVVWEKVNELTCMGEDSALGRLAAWEIILALASTHCCVAFDVMERVMRRLRAGQVAKETTRCEELPARKALLTYET
jgi:hypothetical protein